MITHLDLFSGIGGFALAARWAGFNTVAFCEIEPFARQVLKKNFPGVPIHQDIYKLSGKSYESVTLITGGYPCQPFSHAGNRKGREDDRYLWPEMLRLIKETQPAFVLGENVAGHVGLGLDQVLADLEGEGYTAQALIIPACAVDAPHRRDRVWIVANAGGPRLSEEKSAEERLQEHCESVVRSRASVWGAEPGIHRMGDGIPHGMDRLKSLGNAIVPQVAYIIMLHMKELFYEHPSLRFKY